MFSAQRGRGALALYLDVYGTFFSPNLTSVLPKEGVTSNDLFDKKTKSSFGLRKKQFELVLKQNKKVTLAIKKGVAFVAARRNLVKIKASDFA